MNYFVVDRIEESFYILETAEKDFLSVPKEAVSALAKESSVLYLDSHGIYQVDFQKTAKRQQEIQQKIDQLFHSKR